MTDAGVKRARGVVIAVVGVVVVIALAGLPVYVFPPAEEATPSDAILVLGPPMEQRLALAERMRADGIADQIIVSTQPSGGQTADDLTICREQGVTCEVPDPFTTRGEMLMMAQRADGANAPSVTIITFAPHVMRTRFIFGKCYPGDFTVVAVDQSISLVDWVYHYVYQSIAFIKALFEPCDGAADAAARVL